MLYYVTRQYGAVFRKEKTVEQTKPLSSREQEVLDLLLEGKSNKQIAAALHITIRTVEFHLKNIYEKFEVRSRTELILKLGQSTVAGAGQVAENRDSPNQSGWDAVYQKIVSILGKGIAWFRDANSDARSGGSPMTFFESIRVCLSKYAEFNGRASRSEFWWFALFVTLVGSALAMVHEVLSSIFLIAILLPLLAAGARRLHDTGRSGWWQLFLLVPVGGLVILGFLWAEPPSTALPEDSLPA